MASLSSLIQCLYKSLPQSGVHERCFTWVGSGLTHKHQTMLERLTRDKHSSLLRKSVNYDRIVLQYMALVEIFKFNFSLPMNPRPCFETVLVIFIILSCPNDIVKMFLLKNKLKCLSVAKHNLTFVGKARSLIMMAPDFFLIGKLLPYWQILRKSE